MLRTLMLLIAATGLVVFSGCANSTTTAVEPQARTSARKLQVELIAAEIKPLAVSSQFTGNLLPRRRTVVVSEVDGIVREIPLVGAKIDVHVNGQHYVEQLGIGYGHEVKRGDLLVQLDTADFELEVLVAKAKQAKAEADLADLQAWERPETIERLTSVRDEAKARHELAIKELDRANSLEGAISQSDLEGRRTDVVTTLAILKGHDATLRTAMAGPTTAALAVQRALVAQANAEVQQKENDLAKAAIRAPYDGVVTDMYVEVGQRVSKASGQILELMDLRFLVAEVGVPEAYMAQFQVQDQAMVRIAGANELVPGLIVSINDKLDPESRSFRIRVAIDNIQRRFKAGQFARVTLNVGSDDQFVVLPSRSVTFLEGQPGVFVFEDGKVRRRSVTLGVSDASQTEIHSGLTPGEMIVVDNPTLLTDGMSVEVRATGSPAP